MNNTTTETRYDVLIVHCKTRIVDTIAGQDMRLDTGHTNAEKRMDTVSPRLNDDYFCTIVETGKFAKGDKLPETP